MYVIARDNFRLAWTSAFVAAGLAQTSLVGEFMHNYAE